MSKTKSIKVTIAGDHYFIFLRESLSLLLKRNAGVKVLVTGKFDASSVLVTHKLK